MEKEKVRVSCPPCAHLFNEGTEAQVKMRLYTHLTLGKRHKRSHEEANAVIAEIRALK